VTSSPAEFKIPAAYRCVVGADSLTVHLDDGRAVSAPLHWFPRLLNGSRRERGNWELIARGHGIHWPDLDEDISVESLLLGHASGESAASLRLWKKARARDSRKSRARRTAK
jgi:hypothetical protein